MKKKIKIITAAVIMSAVPAMAESFYYKIDELGEGISVIKNGARYSALFIVSYPKKNIFRVIVNGSGENFSEGVIRSFGEKDNLWIEVSRDRKTRKIKVFVYIADI